MGEASSVPAEEYSPKYASESNTLPDAESSPLATESIAHPIGGVQPPACHEFQNSPSCRVQSSACRIQAPILPTNPMPSKLENLALCLLRSPAPSLPMSPKLSKLQSPVLCLQNPAPILPTNPMPSQLENLALRLLRI